jgi:hypothetical protein
MCIACEMAFMDMLEAPAPEERERLLREEATRFICEPAPDAPAPKDERKDAAKP